MVWILLDFKGQIMPNLQDARSIAQAQQAKIKALIGDDKAKISAFTATIADIVMEFPNHMPAAANVAMSIVQLGLNPNKHLGQAYVVPYNGKPQLQIGYKGILALAYRNGWKFRAVAVYDCDSFSIKFAGLKDEIDFRPNYEARKDDEASWIKEHILGVLVFCADNVGAEFSDFVPAKKLNQLRNAGASANSPAWKNWSEEMYKAKALKYVASKLPIHEKILEAFAKEDEAVIVETVENTPALPQKLDLNAIAKAPSKPSTESVIEAELDLSNV